MTQHTITEVVISGDPDWQPPESVEVGRVMLGEHEAIIVETFPLFPEHVGIGWVEDVNACYVDDRGVPEWMCSTSMTSFRREQWERIKALVDGAFA